MSADVDRDCSRTKIKNQTRMTTTDSLRFFFRGVKDLEILSPREFLLCCVGIDSSLSLSLAAEGRGVCLRVVRSGKSKTSSAPGGGQTIPKRGTKLDQEGDSVYTS